MDEDTVLNELGNWPDGGLEAVGGCPWCGSLVRRQLYTGMTDLVFRCAPGRWTLWRCNSCGSGYLDPRPNQATIHLAYKNYYTHSETSIEEPIRRGWRAQRNRLANGYRNRRYGTRYPNASKIGFWLLSFLVPMKRKIDVAFRFLPNPASMETARVLDIGCGNGAYLALVAQAGWTCFGCDPDPVARKAASARGIAVRAGSAEAWLDAAGSFDAVTMSHVLEHVPDPVDTLETIHQLLRPGGFLYLDLPNIDAFGHRKYGRFWRGLETPRHLTLPTLSCLMTSLIRLGYVDISLHPRFEVTRGMSSQSKQLINGADPTEYPSATSNPLETLYLLFSKKNTEFLTLTAKKRLP